MDVHTPRGPIHSVKAFLIELVTITAGVLIALSFEGLREWNHNRTLAREAKDTIVRELTENKNAVDGDIQGVGKRKQQIEQALQFANDLLRSGKSTIHTISLALEWGDLRRSSWRTAEQTGSLGHMAYPDVQKYAAVYDLQDLYQAQARRSLEHLSDALVIVASGDPENAPRADVERFRAQLLTMSADLFVEEKLASQLRDRYAKALQE